MPSNSELNQISSNPLDKEKKSDLGQPQTFSGSGGTSTGPQTRTASFSSGMQPGGATSGRFTNLSKYLGANQAAGQQLASGIGSRIQQSLQPGSKEFKTSAEKVGEAVKETKGAEAETQSLIEKVKSPTFDPTTASDAEVAEWRKLQSGQALDTQKIGGIMTGAATSGQKLGETLGQRAGQVATESGRYGLLKEAFGGRQLYKPAYTSGQQRLDQLFLQAGGAQDLRGLQKGLQGQAAGVQQSLDVIGKQGEDIQKAIGGYQTAAKDLLSATQGAESQFYQKGEESVAEANARLDADEAKARKVAAILTGQAEGGKQALSPEDLQELGLQMGQQTFDLLGPGSQYTAEQLYNFDPRRAQGFADIATKSDVEKASAWAKLSGQEARFNTTGQLIGPDGQLMDLTTGKKDISKAIEAKKNELLEDAKKQIFKQITDYNYDIDTGDYGWKSGTRGTDVVSANLSDILHGGAITNELVAGQGFGSFDFGDTLNPGWAQRQRAWMNQKVQDQIVDYLKSKGYFTTLGQQGQQINPADYNAISQYGYSGGTPGLYTPKASNIKF